MGSQLIFTYSPTLYHFHRQGIING